MRKARKMAGTVVAIGRRLAFFRQQMRLTTLELSQRLGIKISSYYKNENGTTLPPLTSLNRLQKDFDLSMDWLLFNKGHMLFSRKKQADQAALEALKEAPKGIEATPEVRELLDDMKTDPLLKHEILAYYYKYKTDPTHQAKTKQ